jgi:hypothetical protein
LGPVPWVIISEIYPTRIRGRAMSFGVFAVWATCGVVSQTFPWLKENLGPAGCFWRGGRRRPAVLRRQSDNSSRIDRDALGRFRGGNVRWGTGSDGSFGATGRGWLAQNAPTMVVPEKRPFTERPVARRALGFH